MANKQTTTLTKVREKLHNEGLTVADWSKKNGFNVCSVRAVIYGHNKGNFGNAHKIAVALGIKKGER